LSTELVISQNYSAQTWLYLTINQHGTGFFSQLFSTELGAQHMNSVPKLIMDIKWVWAMELARDYCTEQSRVSPFPLGISRVFFKF
jgi:hypothetical protein